MRSQLPRGLRRRKVSAGYPGAVQAYSFQLNQRRSGIYAFRPCTATLLPSATHNPLANSHGNFYIYFKWKRRLLKENSGVDYAPGNGRKPQQVPGVLEPEHEWTRQQRLSIRKQDAPLNSKKHRNQVEWKRQEGIRMSRTLLVTQGRSRIREISHQDDETRTYKIGRVGGETHQRVYPATAPLRK